MKLGGKVAIITGAGAGIGQATANLFSKNGVKICCNSLTTSASQVVEGILKEGGDAIFIQGDISDEKICKRIVDETINKFGKLDILFNIILDVLFPFSLDNDLCFHLDTP